MNKDGKTGLKGGVEIKDFISEEKMQIEINCGNFLIFNLEANF